MADGGKRRVLITGAGGRIGGHLATVLQDRYSLRLQYNKTMPDTPPVEDWVQADIADYNQIAPAMEGIDAVIHMAGEPSPFAAWDDVHSANIVGTRNVYEAARVAGVRKVVLASTNHVMGFYDRDGEWPIYVSQQVRPDSLYGVSKAFGEVLGRYYADQHGLAVICLRIGWFLDKPHDDFSRWSWLSPRDCTQICWRAVETENLFGIYYAISANSGRHWDLTHTLEGLGYRPEDDGEKHPLE